MATFGEFVDQLFDETPLIQELRKSFFEEGFQAGILQGLEQGVQQEETGSLPERGNVSPTPPLPHQAHAKASDPVYC